ncbi:clavesin-2-like, partial [Centruroides sculpturatus]|uniref:clavesin-2-like n=1 Tax=Centruroides sculpturatus TaxID=218467 RepID=UPI000C6DA1AF
SDCFQQRFREIHFVNVNSIIKGITNIFVPFMHEKIVKRMIMHSEVTTLHKFIHPKYLPVAYGGELPDSDSREFIEILKQNEDFFRQNEEYVKMYDEEVKRRFSEGTFKYIDRDNVNYEDKVINEVEEKFNRIKEDPEYYAKHFEKNALFEVTHL